jgi:hypothetical protein
MDLRRWILGGGKFSHITTQNVVLPVTKDELIQFLKKENLTNLIAGAMNRSSRQNISIFAMPI